MKHDAPSSLPPLLLRVCAHPCFCHFEMFAQTPHFLPCTENVSKKIHVYFSFHTARVTCTWRQAGMRLKNLQRYTCVQMCKWNRENKRGSPTQKCVWNCAFEVAAGLPRLVNKAGACNTIWVTKSSWRHLLPLFTTQDNPAAEGVCDDTMLPQDLALCSLLMEAMEKSSVCRATGGPTRNWIYMVSSTMRCIILQYKMPMVPLRNKTRDNGILMEPGCLSECVSGSSISCTAHTSVMNAQRRLTYGSKPVWYYRSYDCIGISAAVFLKLYTHKRLHFLCEFMVLSYTTHGSANLQGYKNKLWGWIWNQGTCPTYQIARRKLQYVH